MLFRMKPRLFIDRILSPDTSLRMKHNRVYHLQKTLENSHPLRGEEVFEGKELVRDRIFMT